MCASSPTVSLADRFASINIPLVTSDGGNMFDLSAPATLQTIFVELVVSVLDSDGRPATTTLSASLPVAQGGVNSWCYAQAAKVKAEDYIDTVDIMVGSAGSARDLDRLQTIAGVQLAGGAGAHNVTQSLNSRSIESGLLTVALKGKDSFFGQPSAAGASLEIEDLVSLHITGNGLYGQVASLLGDPATGFQIVADQIQRRASLAPSSALTSLCKSSANPLPQASCVLRYDIQARSPIRGLSYEVTPGQAASASSFMQQLVGGSDYAAALGANFSALIASKYQLSPSSKARRAFWINPGYAWTGADVAGKGRFALSQRVIVVALVSFNGESGSSGEVKSERGSVRIMTTCVCFHFEMVVL